MSGILRNWRCLNRRCQREFEAWENYPTCPHCQCIRCDWVPGGGHVVGTARAADAELRALADHFRMDNMNSARRDQAAKIVHPQAPPASGPAHNFGGGFSAVVDPSRGAQCVPTANAVNFKVAAGIGNRLAPSRQFPGIQAGTAVEASHRPGK